MICIKNIKFLRLLTDTNSKFVVLYINISTSCYQLVLTMFQFNSQICSRQTRSSNLLRPSFFTKTICRQAISYRGALYWNEIPSDIKLSTTFQKFKHNLKCHLLSCY